MSKRQQVFLKKRHRKRIILSVASAFVVVFFAFVSINEQIGWISVLNWNTVFKFCGLSEQPDGDWPCTVRAFDVGAADCILIQCEDASVLIDTGTNVESERIAAAIRRCGTAQLDAVFITHNHTDHTGGAATIFSAVPTRQLIAGYRAANARPDPYRTLISAAQSANVPITWAICGDKFTFGKLQIQILQCSADYANENDNSIILRMTYGRVHMLFMGDAEESAEQELLNRNTDLSADCIKLAHHGSVTSTGTALLDTVNPQYAVMSCGAVNPPDEEILRRLQGRRITYGRTDLQGTVLFATDGKKCALFTENS